MKNRKIILTIIIISLILLSTINTVSAATHIIDSTTYSDYFTSSGTLISSKVSPGDTLKIDDLNGKDMIITEKLIITSKDSSSVYKNGRITLKSGASGSTIKDLTIRGSTTPILLDNSKNNKITGNDIKISKSGTTKYSTIVGIALQYASSSNTISGNSISVTGTGTTSCAYGISILPFKFDPWSTSSLGPGSQSNTISGNSITVTSDWYADGIYISQSSYNHITSNTINLDAKSFVYGIVVEHYEGFLSGGATKTTGNVLKNNKIYGKGSMVYLIESFQAAGTTATGNTLSGDGNGVYGYAGYNAEGDTISNNAISAKGTDISKITGNADAIKSGQAGIYYNSGSSKNTIDSNSITSTYQKGGDYAVVMEGSNNKITNNYLISNNNLRQAVQAIQNLGKNNIISGNTPSSKNKTNSSSTSSSDDSSIGSGSSNDDSTVGTNPGSTTTGGKGKKGAYQVSKDGQSSDGSSESSPLASIGFAIVLLVLLYLGYSIRERIEP